MSLDKSLEKILIIDFGSQFTQLIARRIREIGVFSEIVSHKKIKNKDIINSQATSKVGDFIVCASLNSTAFWTVVDVQGVFAKES